MRYLETYLETIENRGNKQLAESIKKTVDNIAPKYLENFSFCDHEIGLLFGNVQSGKTGQMFGVISAATDLGFPVFLVLTTDNVVLQQQTIERVREDLKGFCICDEYDSEMFTENCLMLPTIIVLKKNVRTLKQWSNILGATGFMKGNPLFIIDDEADAASLNTLVNRNGKSSINKYLDEIKARSASSIYLQVTGTPQALLLQTMSSGWHPYFTYYFRPGKGYLGGDFFFPQTEKGDCISYIDTMKNPLEYALLHHLVVSGIMFTAGEKVTNFLIHPSVRKAVHGKYQQEISKIVVEYKANCRSEELIEQFKIQYDKLKPVKVEKKEFSVVLEAVQNLLFRDEIKVLVMNGNASVCSEDYETGSNIIIGGNTLGRGVTFSGLQTIYYTRTAKKPQADTMWQHSRMFGYDRDSGLMGVFIDEHLYKLFSDINATNNSIISQVEKGIDNVKIYYPEGLNPTRRNVLDNKKLSMVSGGTNYYPYSPDNATIADLDKLLNAFDDSEPFYQVNLRLMREIFTHIKSEDDFKVGTFISIIDTALAEKPASQGVLIVRRNRNVAKGTGALLSPNDWHLGASVTDKIVLTMYQMTGEKGWGGKKIWIPNIKLPENLVYYDVSENSDIDEVGM